MRNRRIGDVATMLGGTLRHLRIEPSASPLCPVCERRPINDLLHRVRYCSEACMKRARGRRGRGQPIADREQVRRELRRYRVHSTPVKHGVTYYVQQRNENDWWGTLSKWPTRLAAEHEIQRLQEAECP